MRIARRASWWSEETRLCSRLHKILSEGSQASASRENQIVRVICRTIQMVKTSLLRHTILCSSPFDLDTEGSGGVRHEAANSRDDVMEERAWEAFCLLCFSSVVLVTNAKVGKEDLRRRFGGWRRSQDRKALTRRWLCWARSHVPVSVTGAFLSSGDDTLNELQRKRFQEFARELPEHVRACQKRLWWSARIILQSCKSLPRG